MSARQYVVDERGLANTFAIEPKMYVQESQTGFTPHAELLNGRLAMIGFVSLLVLEVVTGQGLIGFFTNLS
ncbi:high light inducible protein [Gloeocapsa sp. PCC 7428]|uniref:chlorophyll a/b-binding protein n=1 Tax=Gloeocapsa sp. PCC 7428 TaxID=1173026 RepID=UPI0002A60F34|nr:chlorophyll a/b-binding protein [Gloeocapsa sp. PCC 7428]AFZ29373.1 high light inducible protein [Gloeocapsa sp. PCC 7428]